MSNPCIANSSEVVASFNSQKPASTRGLRNTFFLQRNKRIVSKRPPVQCSFQPSICYCCKLLIFTAYCHAKESNDYLCLEVCYGQKKMVEIKRFMSKIMARVFFLRFHEKHESPVVVISHNVFHAAKAENLTVTDHPPALMASAELIKIN